MCNIYAQTKTKEQLAEHFQLSDNRMEQSMPQSGIYPTNKAPIIRPTSDQERELVHLTWGFELKQKDKASKPVTNMRDDKAITSYFWRDSFENRRCLVPATSFCEPKGKAPAIWHWFALKNEMDTRPLFAFAGVWQDDRYAFATTTPNALVASVHPTRMPVILKSHEAQNIWLNSSPQDASKMLRQVPADMMQIVQRGDDRQDLCAA